MARIIRQVEPKYVFVENSPMLIVRGLGRIIADLAQMGFDARWGVLGGSSVGNVAEGERFWLFAYAANRIRRTSFSIETKIATGSEQCASRRQLNRAVGACISSCEHSEMLRNFDDVARNVERLKAIGNGQVPALVEIAWKILSRQP
jgi:DNA (cytosine-5)-methyltransferase 1